MERTPAWGIEPVPERLRVLGLVDNALLWGNLGVSLLVLVAGTYLVPALSLPGLRAIPHFPKSSLSSSYRRGR